MAFSSRNGCPSALNALDSVPRQSTPADVNDIKLDGTRSAGLSVTRDASPVMKRLTPVIGSTTVAPISRHSRPRPVARVSRISHAVRWNISPSAMPPSVVLMKSFSDAWFVSP